MGKLSNEEKTCIQTLWEQELWTKAVYPDKHKHVTEKFELLIKKLY